MACREIKIPIGGTEGTIIVSIAHKEVEVFSVAHNQFSHK